MRILLLLVQYYPIRNPNVYRWSAIAEHWVQQGHEVHILCTRRTGVPAESLENGVWVHRTGHATLLDLAYNSLKINNRRGEVQATASKNKGLSRLILEKIVDATWRKFYWPDGSCLWYRPGKRRALQLHKKHKFDAVISVSLPFTANRIAMAMKRKDPHLHWLMDIEDPFSISEEFWVNNFSLYRWKNRRAEQAALQWANRISVTVQAAKNAYEWAFPAHPLREKIQVVPPMVNAKQLAVSNVFMDFDPDKIHLAYFGTFYDRVRMPDSLVKLMEVFFQQFPEWKARLQFHFFGEIPLKAAAIFEKLDFVEDVCQFHGLVDRETVAAAIQQIDFLVNIGNTTNYHLPSKSAEYMLSSKPIINICQHDNDTFADFMMSYPLICNIFTSAFIDENAGKLHQFLLNNWGKRVPLSQVEALTKPYLVETIAAAYFELLSISKQDF